MAVDGNATAAELPHSEEIADVGIEKENTNRTMNTNVITPSEDASMTPQPPAQDMPEQFEDGDDGGAPRPHSFEFDDEPKLKEASQIDEHQMISDDEENTQHRDNVVPSVLRPSDDEDADSRQVLAAAERNPPVHRVLEAYLVEEEDEIDDTPSQTADVHDTPPQTADVHDTPPQTADVHDTPPQTADVPVLTPDGRDTVYEATPLEPELPWWKRRQAKVLMAIICVLMSLAVSLSVGLGVASSRPFVDTEAAVVKNATTPSGSRLPTKPPTKLSHKCFADRKELKDAVNQYVAFWLWGS